MVFKNKSGPGLERIKKPIQSTFRGNELKATIQCNLKIVDYLDVKRLISQIPLIVVSIK